MTEQYQSGRLTEQAQLQAYLSGLSSKEIGPVVFELTESMAGRGMGLQEIIQDRASRATVDPAILESHTQSLEGYQKFAAVANAIPDDPPNPATLPEGVTYLDKGWYNYAYLYVDPSGDKHVIKIPMGQDFGARARTYLGSVISLVRSKGNDNLEQVEGISPSDRLRIVTRYEEGPSFPSLGAEDLAKIPREHIQKLAADLKDSSQRNVPADMQGEGNLRYNPEKGFILLDPHSAADYKVGTTQNMHSVRNILLNLSSCADESSPIDNALRLRIADELLKALGPEYVDPEDMTEILIDLHRLGAGAALPPWPPLRTAGSGAAEDHGTETSNTTTAGKYAGDGMAGGDSALMRTGTTVAEQIDSLPIQRLQQAAAHLATALQISNTVEASEQAGFHTHITASQQNLEQAITELTTARVQFNAYLANVGLGSLVRPTE